MKRVLLSGWLLALVSLPFWLRDAYLLHITIVTGIFVIAAMSLNLLLGYTGQLSLGHVAFFGIGAYASALTTVGFDVDLFGYTFVHDPWPAASGLLMGVVVAAGCGYLIGKLSFRVRGAYFVIVTVSFAEVIRIVATNWVDLTQGPLAITNIPPFSVSAQSVGSFTFWSKTSNYYLVLVVALAAYTLIKRLVESRLGRAMVAFKENESLAASLGVDATHYLVLAAVVSAGIAGAAGSLYAHYIRIIDPDIFLFINTVTMVIMVISGGKGTLAGPVVGGLIFGFVPTLLRPYASPELQWILYGALMIVIVCVLPRGIVPTIAQMTNVLKPRHATTFESIGNPSHAKGRG
jgi:branched-chain amino acid transport system permease protein